MPANQIQVRSYVGGVGVGEREEEGGARAFNALGNFSPDARRPSPPTSSLSLPHPQYSEKYYDDIYEYRCEVVRVAVRACVRCAPPSCALSSCFPLASAPRSRSLFPLHLYPTPSHVVLPQDIAALLPKGKLLSEVRRRKGTRGCARERASGLSLSEPFVRPRPSPSAPTSTRRSRAVAVARSVSLPLSNTTQAEWRGIGVQQSRGWVHYAIHRPEPHIMLFRYAGSGGGGAGRERRRR